MSVNVDGHEIVQLVQGEIRKGNLVVLVGGPCSGKSWLISQVVDSSAVIDKSINVLREDHARVSLVALGKWAAGTLNSIAVDEVQLLDQRELLDVITASIFCRKGVVIATQQECLIPDQVISAILNHGKDIVFIHMAYWKSGTSMPKCRIEKRISSYNRKLTAELRSITKFGYP